MLLEPFRVLCHKKCNFVELILKETTSENRAEQREHLSQHYAITLSHEMVNSQGISPSNLFIHFLQRGNLMHDLIHLCDVAEMPAALHDTSCIFGLQINSLSQKYWIARNRQEEQQRREGGRRSQMLSLAISLSICSRILATLKTDAFYSHTTHV